MKLIVLFLSCIIYQFAVLRTVSGQRMVGALYFLTNDPRENFVVATGITYTGNRPTLVSSRAYGTGGFGGVTRGASTRLDGIGIDGLASQNPVIVSDNLLFAVNAGSDSVTLFIINAQNPLELTHVQTFHSGGNFPVALAFSKMLQMLCVANSGKNNNVQCFQVASEPLTVTKLPSVYAAFDLPLTNPPNFPDSLSDIQFSPDSTQLFVAIKGNDMTRTPGHFATFHIQKNAIAHGVFTQPVGGITPFGFSIVPGTGINSDVVIAYSDLGGGGFGVARITRSGLMPNSSVYITVPGQRALCWTAFSPRTKTLFLTDPLTNLVTEASVDARGLSAEILAQYFIPGQPLDATIASLPYQDVLFVLAPELPAIQVVEIEKPGKVEHTQEYYPGKNVGYTAPLSRIMAGLAHYFVEGSPSYASPSRISTARNQFCEFPQTFQFNRAFPKFLQQNK